MALNNLDRAIKGRNGRVTLTLAQVHEIKASSVPTKYLATTYGVHISTIQRIQAGARWTHA